MRMVDGVEVPFECAFVCVEGVEIEMGKGQSRTNSWKRMKMKE